LGPAKALRFFGNAGAWRGPDPSRLQSAGGANRGAVGGLSGTARRVRSGDVYLGIAQQLGFSIEDRPGLRDLFKVIVLGILYGLSA
jgi:hypothetical protein